MTPYTTRSGLQVGSLYTPPHFTETAKAAIAKATHGDSK